MNPVDLNIAIKDFQKFANVHEQIFSKETYKREWWFGESVVLMIWAEYCPRKGDKVHINYDECNGGSIKFNKWLQKFNFRMEWIESGIVGIYSTQIKNISSTPQPPSNEINIDDLIKAYKSDDFDKKAKREILAEIHRVGVYPIFINGLTFYRSTRLGQAGAYPIYTSNKTHLYIPFFIMGTCGDDAGVVTFDGKRERIKAPTKMDYQWFKLIADKLRNNPQYDFDWNSFRDNILYPNREHIMKELGINKIKLKRFLEDGMVFLNNFYNNWTSEDVEAEINIIQLFPNFKNFLECIDLKHLEY